MAPIIGQRIFHKGDQGTLKSIDSSSNKCTILVDGKLQVVDMNDLFNRNKDLEKQEFYTSRVEIAKENLANKKGIYGDCCDLFDVLLNKLKTKRREIGDFCSKYGRPNEMNAEQFAILKQKRRECSDISAAKNSALASVLSGCNSVINAAEDLKTAQTNAYLYQQY